jgi:hypothetical protein
MKGIRTWKALLAICVMMLFSGCLFTSKSSFNEAQTQSRILSEQNLAQLAEIENLKVHGRDMENKVIESEKQIAALKEKDELDRRQLADSERENAELFEHFKALARSREEPSPQTEPVR